MHTHNPVFKPNAEPSRKQTHVERLALHPCHSGENGSFSQNQHRVAAVARAPEESFPCAQVPATETAAPEALVGHAFVQLEPADSPELVELERQSFSLPWTEKEFLGAFGQTSFSAFGLRETASDAAKNGKLVAYVSVYHTQDELEILNIAVHTDSRNRGYGQRLLGLVLRIAEKMGIVKAVLEVRVTNTPALRLYRSFGFAQAGVRRGYYPDTGEDALIYVLDMPDRNVCKTD